MIIDFDCKIGSCNELLTLICQEWGTKLVMAMYILQKFSTELHGLKIYVHTISR